MIFISHNNTNTPYHFNPNPYPLPNHYLIHIVDVAYGYLNLDVW